MVPVFAAMVRVLHEPHFPAMARVFPAMVPVHYYGQN